MRSDFGIIRVFVGLFVIAILVLFGFLVFRGGGNETPVNTGPQDVALTEYLDKNITVAMTIDGKINGNDEHRMVRILVNRNERTLEIIRGYQNEVIQAQHYANNDKAFESFLFGLHRSGYGNARKVEQVDPRGVCPRGKRYFFEIWEGANTVSNLWSVSCSRKFGTYGGIRTETENLFKDQITDYSKLVRNVNL